MSLGCCSHAPVAPDQSAAAYPPRALANIPNASREWMLADAWYRRSQAFPADPEMQQEGTFQSVWTGEALPSYAPHGRSDYRPYEFVDSYQREVEAAAIRIARSDGVTNTLFFDGHAGPVPSKSAYVGPFEVLYGFPGTVNRLTPAPFPYVWR